jgi:hypothetical protein
LKTIVYVDGYNLYYGRLKHTPFKWLDLSKLFANHILPFKSPSAQLDAVNFFTAEIKVNFATRQKQSGTSQEHYHRALRASKNGQVSIINGFYTAEQANAIAYNKPPDKNSRVAIWKLEEKQTDVQMALAMFSDAINQRYEQIVVCTNDSDLEPALKMIREQCPNIKIGVVIPRQDPRDSKPRPANARLSKLADWVLPHITDSALADSQFPATVSGKRKKAIKPSYW